MFDKRALQYMFTLRFYHSAWPLVLIVGLIAFIFHMLSWIFLKKMFIALGCFVLYFFRNPKRYTADLRNTIVSPADGNIVEISESMAPTGYGLDDQKMKKVGIFLSPLNVHINRIPVTGMIEQNVYHPGQFLNAISHRAGTHNERRGIVIKMPDGKRFCAYRCPDLLPVVLYAMCKEGTVSQKETVTVLYVLAVVWISISPQKPIFL